MTEVCRDLGLAAVYLIAHGPENRIDDVSPTEAARGLLTNILYFAEDTDLVQAVFSYPMPASGSCGPT